MSSNKTNKREALKCIYPDPDACKYYCAAKGTCTKPSIACSYRGAKNNPLNNQNQKGDKNHEI